MKTESPGPTESPGLAAPGSGSRRAATDRGLAALFSLGSTVGRGPPPGYAYHCEDRALLKGFYFRLFVKPLAAITPASVHPNDVTWLAQAFALLAAGLGLFSFTHEAPGWVWGGLVPLGYLGYIVLDHLDGTHARNTRRSSPLGELTDHWCDAWNAPLLSFAWGLSWCASPVLASSLGFVTSLALCIAYQEHRATGTMRLDTLGSNEALTGMLLSMVAMGIVGRAAITHFVLPFGIRLASVAHMTSLVGSSGAIVMAMRRGGLRLFWGCAPLVAASALIMVWIGLGLDPRLGAFMMAAANAVVAGRIVLERTTGLPARVDWPGQALLVGGVGLALLRVDPRVLEGTAIAITVALIARACADFLWGARSLRRFIRKGEALSLLIAPDADC